MANTPIQSKPNHLRIGLLTAVLLLAAVASGSAAAVPDKITLKVLAELYEPVAFDHALHVDLAECAVCHHQTTGLPEAGSRCVRCHSGNELNSSVACRDCHVAEPFSAETLRKKEANSEGYHIDKPGLKGAYHLNCVGCHNKMGGPTGCQDCHARTATGDAVFHADAQPPVGGKAH